MILRSCCFLMMMCLGFSMTFAAQLKAITVSQQANQTSIYFAVNGPFTHKLFLLTQPERVVLDLQGTKSGVNINQLGLTQGLIKKIRSGYPDAKTLRLVFEVNQKIQVRSAPWLPKGEFKGVRVDIIGSGAQVVMNRQPSFVNKTVTTKKQQPVQIAVKKQPFEPVHPIIEHKTPVRISNSPSKTLRDVIVVLDAGHGGKDPGARGPHHTQEKDVVLAITLKLKQLIDRQPGMRAVLTRSADYYVGLRQRLDIARKYNGDIFVAIHADAFNNPHSNGASVFALSQRGATSEAARWIAEKENYSELGGVNLSGLDDRSGLIRTVLLDLSQTATISASVQMGTRVLRDLDKITSLHNSAVEQARFVVLK